MSKFAIGDIVRVIDDGKKPPFFEELLEIMRVEHFPNGDVVDVSLANTKGAEHRVVWAIKASRLILANSDWDRESI